MNSSCSAGVRASHWRPRARRAASRRSRLSLITLRTALRSSAGRCWSSGSSSRRFTASNAPRSVSVGGPAPASPARTRTRVSTAAEAVHRDMITLDSVATRVSGSFSCGRPSDRPFLTLPELGGTLAPRGRDGDAQPHHYSPRPLPCRVAPGELVTADAKLARRLVLDELFDLSLYTALRDVARGDLVRTLDELIPVETRHVTFWQGFFGLELAKLDAGRRLKLAVIVGACRLFGAPAIHLVLEAIEVHGVRKYLTVWRRYADGPLGGAVREVLEDEFKHEDAVVTGEAARRINPQRVRDIFLGLNDGLVEILGAVSGFFGAFGDAVPVPNA